MTGYSRMKNDRVSPFRPSRTPNSAAPSTLSIPRKSIPKFHHNFLLRNFSSCTKIRHCFLEGNCRHRHHSPISLPAIKGTNNQKEGGKSHWIWICVEALSGKNVVRLEMDKNRHSFYIFIIPHIWHHSLPKCFW